MTRPRRARWGSESGMALVLVMLASMLLLALAGSLALATATESAIAASYRDGIDALYAADAAAGVALSRLAGSAEWTPGAAPYLAGRVDRLLGVDDTPFPSTVTVWLADAGVADRIIVTAQASGPGVAWRTVRLTVARATDAAGRPGVRVVTWEEAR